MHQGKNHLPIDTSSIGGMRLPICQPWEHLSQINTLVVPETCPYNIHYKPTNTTINVTTLALGSWPRQRVTRLQAKRKTRTSHHMLLGVQKVWGNEPSHSQVNSHCSSWSPKWTPESSKCNYKGQNPLPWIVLSIIGNLLKRRCLKWACITHLDIWNTYYDIKKRSRIKLVVWLSTIKSRESTRFPGV